MWCLCAVFVVVRNSWGGQGKGACEHHKKCCRTGNSGIPGPFLYGEREQREREMGQRFWVGRLFSRKREKKSNVFNGREKRGRNSGIWWCGGFWPKLISSIFHFGDSDGVAYMVTRIRVEDGRCYECCVFAREWAYDLACVVISNGFFGWIVILWRDTIVQNIHVTFGCLIPWSSLRQNILPSRRRFSSFHPNPNFQNCFSKCVSTPITSLWSFANPNPKKDFFFLSLIRTSACPCPYCCGTFIRHGMKVSFSWSDLFYGFEEPGTSQCLSILILERGSTAQRSNIAYLSVVTLTILQVVSPWRVG